MTAAGAVDRWFSVLEGLEDAAIFISTAARSDVEACADAIDARAAEEVPLRGMIFAIKDNIDVEGLPTTAGCPSFAYEPSESATVVQRLVAAGAVPVAKTNMDQFATGLVGTRSPYGTPTNPHDPMLVPGGSSAGSAVAVARELVDFALGTDTAGSGRVPAAFCGVVGLKPTLGRLPTTGVVPAVRSADVVSVFARDVDLAQTVMAMAEGPDHKDGLCRAMPDQALVGSPLRVGVIASDALVEAGATREVVAHYEARQDQLSETHGVEMVKLDPRPLFAAGDLLYGGPFVAERTAAVGEAIRAGGDGLDPTVAAIIAGGDAFDAVDAYRANYRLADLRLQAGSVLAGVDAFITPTVPGPATLAEVAADPVGVNSWLGRFTTFANLLDLCAVSVPSPSTPAPEASTTVYAPAWRDSLAADLAATVAGAALRPDQEGIRLVVAGAHLRGQPLETQLLDLGAVWEATTQTAPSYRMYALRGGPPHKPALIHDPAGRALEVDTWRLTPAALGTFLTMVAPPLALGTVTLADGTTATGFVAEPRAVDGATEITHLGGWRAYVATP